MRVCVCVCVCACVCVCESLCVFVCVFIHFLFDDIVYVHVENHNNNKFYVYL